MGAHFTLPGKVYLVGAGPGSAKLLTLQAMEVLRAADLVLHDDLVSEDVLAAIPAHISVHSVGKRCGIKKNSQEEINRRMIAAARAGQTVVRLKGGDPLIFGRTQEEIAALREANVDFQIIPGVTAATAAAASAQIPLTERNGASKLIFVSNHCCTGKNDLQITRAITEDATLVFYMPGKEFEALQRQLFDAGLGEDLPCLLVSQVARSEQKLIRTTLGNLSLLPCLPAPNLLLIGSTVAEARAEEAVTNSNTALGTDQKLIAEITLDLPEIRETINDKLIF
jgi:uroporphyrin-III C-methyltransferase